MQRHFFDPGFEYYLSKMPWPYESPLCAGHHFAAAFQHASPYVIDEGSGHVLRATNDDVVRGISAVATAAMGGKEVVPSIVVAGGSGLTGYGYINGLCTRCESASLRIQFDHPAEPKVRSIGHPQSTRCRVQHKAGVDGVTFFVAIGCRNQDRF